ncbi:MAG: hypothetical protein AABP62_12510 [Planctomycetota bacterium]
MLEPVSANLDFLPGSIMDTIQIPCPKCGTELKLRDRSLLGRKGKCPKCSHAFVLEEPEEVQLELAEPGPPIPDTAALASMEGQWLGQVSEPEPSIPGTAARWIPDTGAPAVATPRQPASRPQSAVPAMNGSRLATSPLPDFESLAANEGAASRLKALQKRNAKRRKVGLAVGAVLLLAVGGATYWAVTNAPGKSTIGGGEIADAEHQPGNNETPPDTAALASDSEFAKSGGPTKGKPIELQFVPFGSEVILNIRPAELWKQESQGEEIRFCLTAPAKFLEATLQDLFQKKPQQIEEAMICLIPGGQGTMPEVAAVIHLVDDIKKSQFLEDLGGERIDDYGHPVYLKGERAYLLHDLKTLAVGPRGQVREMVDAIAGRSGAGGGIEELLPMTDRDRHITFLFVPTSLRLHANYWFPGATAGADGKRSPVASLAHRFCDWLGDEVESVVWSFHLGEKTFYSELLLRNVAGVTSSRLAKDTQKKLDQFAPELLATVQMMNPREVGKRKVIGRLPVMSDAFTMATMVSSGPRHVQLITPLPERAAPNLALGTLLAWDESTRTDFTKKAPTKPAPTEGTKLPDLIADRLKVKIDVDFRRTPLQDAFTYISGEIKTTIDIDGDSLKMGAYTKNMTQDLKLDAQPAKVSIMTILEKYSHATDKAKMMVIVVDEAKKTILVTTQAGCEKNNLTPFDFSK